MAEDMGSTVPRRQLGRALRDLRTEARMTLDGAAEAMQCSRQKMWRIESGLGATRAADVKAMCELYAATPELTAALVGPRQRNQSQRLVALLRRRHPRLVRDVRRPRIRRLIDPALRRDTDSRSVSDREYATASTSIARAFGTNGTGWSRCGSNVRRSWNAVCPPAPKFEAVLSEAVLIRVVGESGHDGRAATSSARPGPASSCVDPGASPQRWSPLRRGGRSLRDAGLPAAQPSRAGDRPSSTASR